MSRIKSVVWTGTKILAGPTVIACAWQYWVHEERVNMVPPKLNPQGTYFFLGSRDDEWMDQLKTGDVVLIKHRWWLFQPLGALIIYLRLQTSDFDHCGVIVRKGLQRPFVLEKTWEGAKLRPYDERVLWSRGKHFLVIPLKTKLSRASEKAVLDYAAEITATRSHSYFSCGWNPVEILTPLGLWISKALSYNRAIASASYLISSDALPVDGSAQLVANVLQVGGVSVNEVKDIHTIRAQDYYSGDLSTKYWIPSEEMQIR